MCIRDRDARTDRPGRTAKQHAGGWRMTTQRLAIPTREGEQRIEHLEGLHIFWQALYVVDHWREIQPDTDEVRQEACDVAEVDLQGAKDHGKPEPERQSLGHHGDGPQHQHAVDHPHGGRGSGVRVRACHGLWHPAGLLPRRRKLLAVLHPYLAVSLASDLLRREPAKKYEGLRGVQLSL